MPKTTTAKGTLILDFFTDPGHGWVAIPEKLIRETDVVLSTCSYVGFDQQGEPLIYCEEDRDANLAIAALKKAGFEITIIDHTSNYDSFIRALPLYYDSRYKGWRSE